MRDIHARYLDAGADIIETNTFNSNAPSQGDYRMEGLVARAEPGGRAPRARGRPTSASRAPAMPRFVAGALGPTNRTASMSPDVNDPGLPQQSTSTSWRRPTRGARAR